MFDEADDIHPLFAGAPSTTEFKKLRKRIVRQTREAIEQYGMVDPSAHDKDGKPPRWLVCLSGGKDSYAMIWLLREVWRKAPFDFDIVADQRAFQQLIGPEEVRLPGGASARCLLGRRQRLR